MLYLLLNVTWICHFVYAHHKFYHVIGCCIKTWWISPLCLDSYPILKAVGFHVDRSTSLLLNLGRYNHWCMQVFYIEKAHRSHGSSIIFLILISKNLSHLMLHFRTIMCSMPPWRQLSNNWCFDCLLTSLFGWLSLHMIDLLVNVAPQWFTIFSGQIFYRT